MFMKLKTDAKKIVYTFHLFFCTKTNAVSFMNFCLEICNCFIMKLNDSVANFGKFMISCEIC